MKEGNRMDSHTIRVRDIRQGNTIIEDVFVNTNFPIIRRNTTMTTEHKEVLRAFGVKQVKIEQHAINREESLDSENGKVLDGEELLLELGLDRENVQEKYNRAVKEYKKRVYRLESRR